MEIRAMPSTVPRITDASRAKSTGAMRIGQVPRRGPPWRAQRNLCLRRLVRGHTISFDIAWSAETCRVLLSDARHRPLRARTPFSRPPSSRALQAQCSRGGGKGSISHTSKSVNYQLWLPSGNVKSSATRLYEEQKRCRTAVTCWLNQLESVKKPRKAIQLELQADLDHGVGSRCRQSLIRDRWVSPPGQIVLLREQWRPSPISNEHF